MNSSSPQDQYPFNQRDSVPPPSSSSVSSSSRPIHTAKTKTLDRTVGGIMTVLFVLLVFVGLVFLIKNISPDAPVLTTNPVPSTNIGPAPDTSARQGIAGE